MPENRPSIKEITLTLPHFHGIMEVERMPPDRMERSVVPMAEKTGINRQYKDRLFKFIFGNPEHKEWTLALYNAINGSFYDNPDDIELNTIEDVLYMGMKNDVSFIITETINFYEQQSSFNPNVPLRIFGYAEKSYSKYIEDHKLNVHSTTLQKIPTPRCVCFYNGPYKKEDKVILRLSDAFMDNTEEPQIEVTVTMYNINYGHNKELLDACKPLMEYSWIVKGIREKAKMMDIKNAIDEVIDNLPNDFVLKPFLDMHKAEVGTMLLTEYNEVERDEFILKKGMEKGMEKGNLNAIINMMNKLKLTAEQAMDVLNIPKEEFPYYKSAIDKA
jgi:hypothetical protein